MAHCTQTIQSVLYNLFSKCLLISICLSFIYLPLKAQKEKIVFKKYGVEEGLPEEYVTSIFQDKQGFIWFTTQNGLVKFDGYEFKTYRSTSEEGDERELKLRNLNGKMLVGKDGKLWLGGVETPGGIASFDPRTEEFHNYLTDSANSIHYYFCYVMLEDKRGNIWFSNYSPVERTNVLCRLNPKSGKLYTYPYSNIFGRYNAVIYSQHGYIAETSIAGSDSTIWILDRAFNLRKWVPEVDTFAIVVPAGTPFPGTGETDKIITIAQNITDELLITGENGLYVWGLIEQKVIKHHTYDPNNSNSLAPGIPRYSFKDHWGLYWVINQNGNITSFNPRTEIYTRYLHGKEPMIFSDTLKPYWPLIIWYDDYEEFFYEVKTGGNGTGFLRYDLSSRSFQYYDHNFNEPSNKFPVSANGYYVNGYFFKDHSKTLWYGFRGSLNKEVPPPKKQMALYQHNENDPFSLPPGYIRNLYEDSRKRVWVATNTSLVRYIPERDHFEEIQFFPESESAKRANEILEDSEGLIWITTEDGLYLFDESTQSCKKVPDLPGRAVINILEDHLHRLWISVWEKGIYVLDKYSFDILKSFEPIEGDSTSLQSKRIRIMYQDTENRIWAGDEYDNGLGLFRLNDSETGFIHYNSTPKASNYIFSNEIRFLAEDSENQLWVGTDGGLQRYDPANDRFQVYPDLINLPSINAYSIDAEGEFWLGTYSGGGLVRIRNEGLSVFGESKGLLHNDTGMSIHTRKLPVDHLGRIYYPTRRGLSVFDPKTETFQNYFEKDGFQPYATYYASMVTQDGDVWIGSANGLNRIQPDQLIEKDTTLPFVHITAVEILDSIYSAPDGNIFKQAVSFTDKIVLSHDQNDLAFEFVALHYAHPEENQYSWKLENRDDEWSKPSLERRVRYANLTPGTYTFRVKASNADGVWNEEGDFLQIVISPPWWTTWWAIAGFVVLFLFFVYVFYRYQLSSRLEHAENLRLKELDSVKSRLYTNITHEFRTPLTVINGMAEQIIEPEESRKMILRNSQHLLRLVNQMLDLAKLESGKLELNLVLGNIIAYLQYLVESFHSFAASKNIELVFYPEMGEFLMDYDEEKLQHIISNLLSNAIKFSPEGSKVILHVSEDKTKDSEFLLIKVKDKGIGIAPDKLPHIFDRFYQVDDSSTRKGEGTGIGLTLTRELIHLMGGNITVESKVNAGTTFMVSLPVSRSAAPVTDIPRSEVSTMGLPVGLMTEDMLPANEDLPVVLIIEDNPDVVFYIKTCLKDHYQLLTAENGALGIQKALDQIPDLIISDVMMPEKDGFEVCQTLKQDERSSHIPIILLTAKADMESRITGLQEGADVYLAKPFEKKELLVRINQLIQLRRKLQDRYRNIHGTPLITDEKYEREDGFVRKVRLLIEEHLSDDELNVEFLARELGMSRSQLFRKLKALTDKSVVAFIRSYRLSRGRQLLKTTDLSVSEVAYEVGFNSPAHFSAAFLAEFGTQPSTMRD